MSRVSAVSYEPSAVHVLVVERIDAYELPDLHGPFDSLRAAQEYAETFREQLGLPAQATPANNEAWTAAGWYFGIFQPGRINFGRAEPPGRAETAAVRSAPDEKSEAPRVE